MLKSSECCFRGRCGRERRSETGETLSPMLRRLPYRLDVREMFQDQTINVLPLFCVSDITTVIDCLLIHSIALLPLSHNGSLHNTN